MRIREHGNGLAIALSLLAVVLVGSGTAVAVTATQVTITDPTNPARAAKVDTGGRLAVAGAVSTIDSTDYLRAYLDTNSNIVLSPTTASVAISRIQVSNPTANAGAAEQQLFLNRYPADANGVCLTTQSPILLAQYNVAPGDDIDDALPAPLLLTATGGAQYCLAIDINYLGPANSIPQYYLSYGLVGYVTTGTYTGLGAGKPVKPQGSAKITP